MKQSVHLTLGILRQSQAVFYALAFFWLDGFAVPAPAQVTQTVGQQSPAPAQVTQTVGQVGFCAFFEHFSGFGFFLLSGIFPARPLAGNANR
jgi:hypothetical protein